MYMRALCLDAGPATLMPLVHVPLLHDAPRSEGEYKAITDTLGDLCHFYGDFAGYHLYLIASSYKKRINSVNYYDKENGKFSISLSVTHDNGVTEEVNLNDCHAQLYEQTFSGLKYPDDITIEHFSVGTPDALKFHFRNKTAKFKFSNNLVPFLPEEARLSKYGLFNLKIEYIGKAVGKDGTREIADRLGNGHSTESSILNEFVHKKTNRDAFAILYKPGRLTDQLGNEDSSMSYSEVVDALEKSLIASFLPAKNILNRKFPNDGSVTTQKLIGVGVSRLLITANSPEDYGLLFTEDAEPERVHRFDLKINEYR